MSLTRNVNPIFHLKEKDSLIKMGFFKTFFKVIGIIILIIITALVLAFFFLPVKLSDSGIEVGKSNTICYSKTNASSSNISCTSDSDCVTEIKKQFNEAKASGNTEEQIPEFFIEYLIKGTYCEEVCKMKQIRGFSGENVQNCNADELAETITLTPYKLLKMFKQMK